MGKFKAAPQAERHQQIEGQKAGNRLRNLKIGADGPG